MTAGFIDQQARLQALLHDEARLDSTIKDKLRLARALRDAARALEHRSVESLPVPVASYFASLMQSNPNRVSLMGHEDGGRRRQVLDFEQRFRVEGSQSPAWWRAHLETTGSEDWPFFHPAFEAPNYADWARNAKFWIDCGGRQVEINGTAHLKEVPAILLLATGEILVELDEHVAQAKRLKKAISEAGSELESAKLGLAQQGTARPDKELRVSRMLHLLNPSSPDYHQGAWHFDGTDSGSPNWQAVAKLISTNPGEKSTDAIRLFLQRRVTRDNGLKQEVKALWEKALVEFRSANA